MVRLACVAALLLTAVSCKAPNARPTATPAIDEGLEIHGHRGARGLRPENTLVAFEHALELGVDVLELDLQFSKDQRLIVWHDPYVFAQNCRVGDAPQSARITTATKRPSLTRDNPLAAEVVDPDALPMLHPATMVASQSAAQLRKLRCDRNPDPERFPEQSAPDGDYGIVTLGEVFELANARSSTVRFNIELKRSQKYPSFVPDGFDGERPAAFERTLHNEIVRHGMQGRVIVQSFDHRVLDAFRRLEPTATLSALVLDGVDTDFVALAERGITVWSPHHALVTGEAMQRARNARLRVIPWTVNDEGTADRLMELGVDGIITDRPDVLLRMRASR